MIELANDGEGLVVGLDFAFSFPVWFLGDRGVKDVGELWTLVAEEGEAWLEACEPPFWGRPGTTRPDLPADFRLTEEEAPAQGGISPKSVFQVGGAGAVGTGSIRGMPWLRELREAGFSIWPFDAADLPLVIEIYPRVLTGAVLKSDHRARRDYLAARFPNLDGELRERAAASDHAFDAAVSALVMDRHLEGILNLPDAGGLLALEGAIWFPDPRGARPSAGRGGHRRQEPAEGGAQATPDRARAAPLRGREAHQAGRQDRQRHGRHPYSTGRLVARAAPRVPGLDGAGGGGMPRRLARPRAAVRRAAGGGAPGSRLLSELHEPLRVWDHHGSRGRDPVRAPSSLPRNRHLRELHGLSR